MPRREDTFEKYLKLLGLLLLAAVVLVLGFLLLLIGFRGLFGLFNTLPWMAFVYRALLVIVPFAVFVPAYVIFFRRTATHPAPWVRIFSRLIFAAAILSWFYSLVSDMIVFFRKPTMTVEGFLSFNLFFVAGHIACIFFIGILQALTTVKEKDWMDRD